jgi:hypothetical protein
MIVLLYFYNQAVTNKNILMILLSLLLSKLCLFIQIQTIQRLKEERDNNLQQNQQMQRELVLYIELFPFDIIISYHIFC